MALLTCARLDTLRRNGNNNDRGSSNTKHSKLPLCARQQTKPLLS